MSEEQTYGEQFWAWCADQGREDIAARHAAHARGLALLIEAVKAGDIDTIDGVDSPLSLRLRARHESDLFEMNTNWISTAQSWVCPCCSRTKFEISRLGKKGQILAKLVIHHDHMGEATEAAFHQAFAVAGTKAPQHDGHRLIQRVAGSFAAYEEVLICEDCNIADTEAKKLVGAPKYFSFSIGQIKRFTRPSSHVAHRIDGSMAIAIWEKRK